MIGLSDAEIEEIFKGIYEGSLNPENLPEDLYAATAEKLKEAIYKGFGGSLKDVQGEFGYGSAPAELLKDLRENIYLFAGAKTFQQTEEMRGFLVKDDKVLTYSEFREKAKVTFDRYNESWMQTEYNTAIGQSESARKWSDIQANKGIFPMLKYNAVIDSHTSEICRPFDNLILPVDHPFWQKFMPLNHYNCRCIVEQLESDVQVSTSEQIEKAIAHGQNEVSTPFQMNPGKTGEVFSKDHPYFTEIPKEYKELAKENFNLPIPEPQGYVFKEAKTEKEAVERIKAAGVEKVDLKGLKMDYVNEVLKSIEGEAQFKKLRLTEVSTFKRKSSNASAYYYPGQRKITINLSHLNIEPQELLTWEQRIEKNNIEINRIKELYLGNPKYKQSQVVRAISQLKTQNMQYELNIERGTPPKWWSMSYESRSNEGAAQSLGTTITHELGHHRDFELRKELKKGIFIFNPAKANTTYGETSRDEYFAEWFAQYRKKGPNGVPEDLIKIFESIK